MNLDLVEKAMALKPVLRERARDAEIARQTPRETVDNFIEAGILKTIQPQCYGGHQTDWETVLSVIMALAQGDASQAWVAAVYSIHALDVTMFPEQAQDEVWGENLDQLIVSAVAPSGIGKRADDGIIVSGRWGFVSGVAHGTWAEVGFMMPDAKSNEPVHHLCLVPAENFTIEDTWHVMGITGSGSNHISLQDELVPSHRVILRTDQRAGTAPGTSSHDDKIYATPYLSVPPAVLASVVVGAAEGALEEYIEFTKAREQHGNPVAERESIQLRIAEASAEIDLARVLLLRIASDATSGMRSVGKLSTEMRARMRRDTAYACTLSKRAVERLFEASGAHGLYLSEAFQRFYRDVKAGSNHIAIGWDRCGLTYGRVALGFEPGPDEI